MEMRSRLIKTTVQRSSTLDRRTQTWMALGISAISALKTPWMIWTEMDTAPIRTAAPRSPTQSSLIAMRIVWAMPVIPVTSIPSMMKIRMGSAGIWITALKSPMRGRRI